MPVIEPEPDLEEKQTVSMNSGTQPPACLERASSHVIKAGCLIGCTRNEDMKQCSHNAERPTLMENAFLRFLELTFYLFALTTKPHFLRVPRTANRSESHMVSAVQDQGRKAIKIQTLGQSKRYTLCRWGI